MSSKVGRNTVTWKRLRLRCFKRDKQVHNRCWLCGGAIDYDAQPGTTPDSWEPDHRHSVKTHPELAEVPENIMPSHKRCNRAKGSKAGISNLGNRSREW